jgi:hypothetical protein
MQQNWVVDWVEFWHEGTKWEFDITNNNYWSCWDTSNGVYESDNDYSCE